MAEFLFDLEEYTRCATECAAEGIVLLKNDGDILPLASGTRIALFGRNQFHYYKSGTGSGGKVNVKKVTGVREALKEDTRFTLDLELEQVYLTWLQDHPDVVYDSFISEPWFQEEMPVSDTLAQAAAARNDVAVVLIGRTAGEELENTCSEGSWLLTKTEEAMLAAVTGAFRRTVVLLNTSNIIDMNWVDRYRPGAVAYIWQGGEIGGHAADRVLSGDVCPCGRLTDSIAKDISDYPSDRNFGSNVRNVQEEDIYVGYRYFETFAKDRVLYPFGFGLSYTDFTVEAETFRREEAGIALTVRVTNTGSRPGKEVVQVYAEAPQGKLGKPARSLIGFRKTETLAPGGSTLMTFDIPDILIASYDDGGKTGYRSAYVLEAGTYRVFAGSNVRDAKEAGRFTLLETLTVGQLSEALAPPLSFRRMIPAAEADGSFRVGWETVPTARCDPQADRAAALPPESACTGDRGILLRDVGEGRETMEAFIAQFTDEELACIVRGEGLYSPKVTPGTVGAFGGVTDTLRHYGIPVVCCTDGPSGIRMDTGTIAFSLPNGACLACTWNEGLLTELFTHVGAELRKNKVDVLLGPGMNLHRHPLGGRNFEYFAEDPLLSGKIAAAELRGLHRSGSEGTIKHFAMNTQETARRTVEHIVSERAARELYLRSFEIAVKEGPAHSVMTTYGPVNGYYTSSSYDLTVKILRNEWGFTGIVMTDWWVHGNDKGQPGDYRNMAAMIRAENDLNMVTKDPGANTTDDNSLAALGEGTVTRGEYQRSAANICRFILRTPAYQRTLRTDGPRG